MEVLLKTICGSHLYGLAHAESDLDYFTVVFKKPGGHVKRRYAKQTIVNGIDSNVVDLSTFMLGCSKGVPQYLEVLWSHQAEIDNMPWRWQYRAGNESWNTYFRTIKSFALDEGYKNKRHALRLALNLRDIGRYGRFNPTLNKEDVKYISDMAYKSHEDVYGLARCIAW